MWARLSSLLNNGHWLPETLAILGTVIALIFFESLIFRYLQPRFKRGKLLVNEVFVYALHRPLQFLFVFIGAVLMMQIVSLHFPKTITPSLVALTLRIGFVLALTWFLLRFINHYQTRYWAKGKGRVDKTTLHATCQILRASVWAVGLLIVMQVFGVPISGVLAFGGVAGAAVAFAAKDLLANFFGSLMIFLDRPFSVGDWIRSPDRAIEGTVEYIGWRLTCIRTFDKRPLYVPNSVFSTVSVENPSRMTHRRLDVKVGVRYSDTDKIVDISDQVEKMLRAHTEIDEDQTIFVRLIECADSSLVIRLYAFVLNTEFINFYKVQQDVLLQTMEIIKKNGAECAFPTRTLHLYQEETIQ